MNKTYRWVERTKRTIALEIDGQPMKWIPADPLNADYADIIRSKEIIAEPDDRYDYFAKEIAKKKL